jgi:hypothetical protein
MVVRLPVGDADPAGRLARVHRETVRAKRDQYPDAGFRLLSWLARTGLMRWYVRRQRWTNVVESNVAGPPAHLTAFGAPVLELIPIGVLSGNLTVAFVALSYAGQLVVTVVADADRYPDLPVLADALAREWTALLAGIGPQQVGTFGPSAS